MARSIGAAPGLASLGGVPFRIDPTSAEWDMSVKSAEHKTLGGKVVQILGVDISDIVVKGSFGGWKEQRHFLVRMKKVADRQIAGYVQPSGVQVEGAEPMRFLFPPRGWDFDVYLKAFTQAGSDSVVYDLQTIAPPWQLTLWVVENKTTGTLDHASKNAIIARLSAGMGWKQTRYNGPLSYTDIEEALGGKSIEEWLQDRPGEVAEGWGWEGAGQ